VEDDPEAPSFYYSEFAVSLYGSHTGRFEPTSFHFHHPTEHAINGLHDDIAFHLAHYLNKPAYESESLLAAYAVGVWFSVDGYDRAVS